MYRKTATLLTFLLLVLCLAQAEAYSDVTAKISFEQRKGYVGHPVTANYEIKGGSGKYKDIYLIFNSYSHYHGFEGEYIPLSSSKGTGSYTPLTCNSVECSLYVTDAVTGKEYDFYESIPVYTNPDIQVEISVPESSVLCSEVTANYQVHGKIKNATVRWILCEFDYNWETAEDCYAVFTEEQKVSASQGSFSYVPLYGDAVLAVIQGCDEDGNYFYLESDPIVLTGEGIPDITATVKFKEDYGYVGHSVSADYEFSGGSGQYEDIVLAFDSVSHYHCLSGKYIELSSSKGTESYTPLNLNSASCCLYVTDAVTGKDYEFYDEIPVYVNPDIQVEINAPESSALGSSVTANYQVHSKVKNATVYWIICKFDYNWETAEDCYADFTKKQKVISSKGSFSFVPYYGDALIAAIKGIDENGSYFYAESDPVLLTGEINLPKTGDSAKPLLWALLCLTSLAGIVLLRRRSRSSR